MRSIEALYRQLNRPQKRYFNINRQIGYGAIPIQIGPKQNFDPLDLARTRGGKPIGEFPEMSDIEAEVINLWGSTSIPMQYFNALRAAPSQPLTYDNKNNTVSGPQTDRYVREQRRYSFPGEFQKGEY